MRFLKVYLKQVTGKEPTRRDLENNFSLMDADGSGVIDKVEALDYLASLKQAIAMQDKDFAGSFTDTDDLWIRFP